MEYKGLCSTCANVKTCVFTKDPVVWQCEEFSEPSNGAVKHGARIKNSSYHEALSEAE